MNKRLIVIMGVSGTGKSTVARALAKKHQGVFLDGDDFHSEEAKSQMARNAPLTDSQRLPWINRMILAVETQSIQNDLVILAYSGLKFKHRELFRNTKLAVQFFWLTAEADLISQRLQNRQNHFVNGDFLQTQLTALESPTNNEKDVIAISIATSVNDIVAHIGNLIIKQ